MSVFDARSREYHGVFIFGWTIPLNYIVILVHCWSANTNNGFLFYDEYNIFIVNDVNLMYEFSTCIKSSTSNVPHQT